MKTMRVRRERPSAVSWGIALVITMLIVYILTLDAGRMVVVESVSAAPRITREVKLEAQKLYFISMCLCETSGEARMRAAGLISRGAAGYAYESAEGWHVLGAAYEKERDAQRIAERLKADEGISAAVLAISADEVAMRITAPEAQIEAIIAADDILRNQTFQLGNMALQLDRGNIKPAAVRTLCAVGASEAGGAAATLKSIPEAEGNALCAALIDRLNKLGILMNGIEESDQTTSADLSGMLRCAQIDNFIGHCGLQTGLLNGWESGQRKTSNP